MLSAREIVELQDERTRAWHVIDEASFSEDSPPTAKNAAYTPDDEHALWLDSVSRQHRSNFDLWHIEDEARAPEASEAEIAAVKRRVDRTNQLRNDLSEGLDRFLLDWLKLRSLPNPAAKLNSESPGLMVDRLSILALKIYHTRDEGARTNAPADHLARNLSRLAILEEQRADLAHCLDELWRETLAGTRRFKLYQQLKMYNDPSLNPAIYRQLSKETGG